MTIRQFKVMAAKRHNNQVTGLPSLVGTSLVPQTDIGARVEQTFAGAVRDANADV